MSIQHQVEAGETLGKIAQHYYGDASAYPKIVAANHIQDPNLLQVGTILIIPDIADSSNSTNEQSCIIQAEQLRKIMPHARTQQIEKYAPVFGEILPKFSIHTPLRISHYIAQIAHESGELNYEVENLNYSESALCSVFAKYFPNRDVAQLYAHQPPKIANRVYANRMGNGNEASGDGWNYRGRGLIQLTGKDNYYACGQDLKLDLVAYPNRISEEPRLAVMTSCWFWNQHTLNQYADANDIRQITKRINGGYTGLEERQKYLDIAQRVFQVTV